MLVPITPPPMITTSAVAGTVRELEEVAELEEMEELDDLDDMDKRPIPSGGRGPAPVRRAARGPAVGAGKKS
ncbi:hypothetical protein ACWDFH_02670 [Streptomyces kronopolitis]|uniref:hypothetical protein n=1 Tax=Streptomyces kronopolitis TaxID=1612435 RepID=UPI0036C1D924